jgi:hypothetical protein
LAANVGVACSTVVTAAPVAPAVSIQSPDDTSAFANPSVTSEARSGMDSDADATNSGNNVRSGRSRTSGSNSSGGGSSGDQPTTPGPHRPALSTRTSSPVAGSDPSGDMGPGSAPTSPRKVTMLLVRVSAKGDVLVYASATAVGPRKASIAVFQGLLVAADVAVTQKWLRTGC